MNIGRSEISSPHWAFPDTDRRGPEPGMDPKKHGVGELEAEAEYWPPKCSSMGHAHGKGVCEATSPMSSRFPHSTTWHSVRGGVSRARLLAFGSGKCHPWGIYLTSL